MVSKEIQLLVMILFKYCFTFLIVRSVLVCIVL